MKQIGIALPKDHHSGDTFREIVNEWLRLGLVQSLDSSEPRFVTMHYRGKQIILYDWPVLTSKVFREPHDIILFGNEVPNRSQGWIFWGRKPVTLDRIAFENPVSQKILGSIFIGNHHNSTQGKKRTIVDWSSAVDYFDLNHSTKPRFTQEEYLKKISEYYFGLTLPGRGPKCNREIELIGCGTIPIITPGVSIKYNRKWIEGKHYITASSPKELEDIIARISEEEAKAMSEHCRELYQNEYSIEASFRSTMQLVDTLIDERKKNYTYENVLFYIARDLIQATHNIIVHDLKLLGIYRKLATILNK